MNEATKIIQLLERIQQAAGLLIMCPGFNSSSVYEDYVLLFKRSHAVNDPGMWGITGGSCDANEDPLDTALRETVEEAHIHINKSSIVQHIKIDASSIVKNIWSPSGEAASGLIFHTFVAKIDHKYARLIHPILDWENVAWNWITVGQALSSNKTHPGVKAALQQLNY